MKIVHPHVPNASHCVQKGAKEHQGVLDCGPSSAGVTHAGCNAIDGEQQGVLECDVVVALGRP